MGSDDYARFRCLKQFLEPSVVTGSDHAANSVIQDRKFFFFVGKVLTESNETRTNTKRR
jgi:hypothetical protein